METALDVQQRWSSTEKVSAGEVIDKDGFIFDPSRFYRGVTAGRLLQSGFWPRQELFDGTMRRDVLSGFLERRKPAGRDRLNSDISDHRRFCRSRKDGQA